MECQRFAVVLVGAVSVGFLGCDGSPIETQSSQANSSEMVTVSSSSVQVTTSSTDGVSGDASSGGSSSLGVGECPAGFNSSPKVAVMDIELDLAAVDVVWSEFSLPVVMPRLAVAEHTTKPAASRWAISFSLFPKAYACSLPPVTLSGYVQSFEVTAIDGDALVDLTPYMNAANSGEGWHIDFDDKDVVYALSDWNGLAKNTQLGHGYDHYFEGDSELTLSFNSVPPILNTPIQLQVVATFNDGAIMTRTTEIITLRE